MWNIDGSGAANTEFTLKSLKYQFIFMTEKINEIDSKIIDEIIVDFRKVSKKYNTQNLCFKSILFATNIHIMNAIFPEVKFVMTVRDPRDIIASMLQVSDKQIKSNITPQYPKNMKVLSDFILIMRQKHVKDQMPVTVHIPMALL